MGKDLGVNRETIGEAVKRLVEAGEIMVRKRRNGQSNCYTFPQTGRETRPVEKPDRPEIPARGGRKTRPVPAGKPGQTKTDPLNETQGCAAAPPDPPDHVPFEEIINAWNAVADAARLPKVEKLTDARKRRLTARWGELGFRERCREAMEKVGASAFCRGDGDKGWRADFDWFIKNDGNYVKALEGKYDDRPKGNRPPAKGTYTPAPGAGSYDSVTKEYA